MAILIIRNDHKEFIWKEALLKADPDLDVYAYLEPHPEDDIQMVAVWKHPAGSLNAYKNLKGVHSMGAGVDFIMEERLPVPGIPIVRVVDPSLTADMAEYVLTQCLAHIKGLSAYKELQGRHSWKPEGYKRASETTVGIMGLGELGKAAAAVLIKNGFRCRGWTRKSKPQVDFPCYTGAGERDAFLSGCNILVCLLPLTPDTADILNDQVFNALPRGTFLINAARGGHLEESSLIQALESGQLSGACLDVFKQEPLPEDHPFWGHKSIRITPHVASVSDPKTVAQQLVSNYKTLLQGQIPLNTVDPARGY